MWRSVNLNQVDLPKLNNCMKKAVSTYTTGFKGAYLLQKPGTDQGIAIILWEKIDDMQENQTEAYKKILQEMSHLFTTQPNTSFYELCSEIGFPN